MGTPPNVAMAGLLEEHASRSVPFLEWSAMAFPFSSLLLVLVYFLLTRMLCPVAKTSLDSGVDELKDELENLGAWTAAEKRVAIVFAATAVFWMGRRFIVAYWDIPLNDTSIAMVSGLLLFVLPAGKLQQGQMLLTWEDTKRLPWDILLLFGGGLTLAKQLAEANVLGAIADAISTLPHMSPSLLIAGFVVMALFLTEVMSNLALTVVMVPVVAQVALNWEMDPLLLVVPVTMASSCAFMLPMATPPNAIVFGSGRLKMSHMVKVGLVLNVVAAFLTWLWAMWVLPQWMQLF